MVATLNEDCQFVLKNSAIYYFQCGDQLFAGFRKYLFQFDGYYKVKILKSSRIEFQYCNDGVS